MKLAFVFVAIKVVFINCYVRNEIGVIKEYTTIVNFYDNADFKRLLYEFVQKIPAELWKNPIGDSRYSENNFRTISNHLLHRIDSLKHSGDASVTLSRFSNSTLNCDLECLEEIVLKYIESLPLSPDCKNDTMYLFTSVSQSMYESKATQGIPWSWRMLDAMGKPGAGVLDGNLWWKGSEFECRNVKAPQRSEFQGQYCYAIFKLPGALGCHNVPGTWCMPGLPPWKCPTDIDDLINAFLPVIRFGLCIPNRCSETDASIFIENIFNGSDTCGTICYDRYVPWHAASILMAIFISIIFVLCVVGTFYDYVYYQPAVTRIETNFAGDAVVIRRALFERTRGYTLRSLLAFSFYSNGKQILSTEVKPGQIIALHGIRVCSLLWVILAHSYQAVLATDNVVEPLKTLPKELINLTVTNGTFSVDTFFLLSGILLSYLWNKEIQKNAKRLTSGYSWLIYYVHRYIRLTPVYAIVLAFYSTMIPYIVKGAIHRTADAENCADHWWANLLYINNIYKPNQLCYSISWYLGNDMQFYCLAPFLLVPMFYYPISTAVVWTFVCFGSMAGNAYTIYYYHIAPTVVGAPLDPVYINKSISEGWFASGESISWDLNYCAPWIRFPPYVIGMFLGYFFANRQRVNINKYVSLVIWCIAWITALSLVYGLYDNERGRAIDLGTRVFYMTICRPLWTVCVAWVIFACHYGYGGWINEFLSYRGFIPLARISFCAYLSHISVEYIITFNWGKATSWNGHFNWVEIWHDDTGDNPSWFLELVEVYDGNSDTLYMFACKQWLASCRGDAKTSIMLNCTQKRIKRKGSPNT